jgi:thiamine-phosphate pyrophosphorylase
MASLMLPRLVLIAEGFTRREVADRVVMAMEAGVTWVHLRDHEAGGELFERAARELAGLLSDDVLLSVNARLPVATALGTGFHTGARGPGVSEARAAIGAGLPVGYSAHTIEEGRAAAAAGADYLFFSPVYPTSSKPGHPGAGLDALRDFCGSVPDLPVFALGGVTPDRVAECVDAGAHGVAVLSGILAAPNIAAAVIRYLDSLGIPKLKRARVVRDRETRHERSD